MTSRGKYLLELALRKQNDQPMTFLVNNDGSLTRVDDKPNELPAEFVYGNDSSISVQETIDKSNES